ncbi:MAG: sugar ABC transporter permease [Anaerolineales bacterium]|nr:sugar ABC transporter permease [Anaerolineales bacterium]
MTTLTKNAPPAAEPRPWLDRLRQRLGRPEFASLPVLVGLAVVWIFFQLANPNFLTSLNLSNLVLQIAAVGTIAIGLVLVLLLGEIDLSVGAVSGLAAAVMAVLNVRYGVAGGLAVLAGLGTGLLIGLLHGTWITKLRIPSFIVTLAGLLGWQGVLLYVLGTTGTVNLRDPFILGLAGTFLKRDLPNGELLSWVLAAGFALLFSAGQVWERRQRLAAGLAARPRGVILAQSLLVAAGLLGATAILNADRGLPSALIFFLGLAAVFDLVVRRTSFGRHILVIGGNVEAARRASLHVDAVRIAVFGLASMLAAFGGILAASRLLAVHQSSGSGDVLLNAIAAAVIGGTSVFGGRGGVWSAVLGALVIGSIANGMVLLAAPAPAQLMATGAALLTAVTVDAVARRGREAAGA